MIKELPCFRAVVHTYTAGVISRNNYCTRVSQRKSTCMWCHRSVPSVCSPPVTALSTGFLEYGVSIASIQYMGSTGAAPGTGGHSTPALLRGGTGERGKPRVLLDCCGNRVGGLGTGGEKSRGAPCFRSVLLLVQRTSGCIDYDLAMHCGTLVWFTVLGLAFTMVAHP